MSVHGAPRYRRSDNRPEFVARAILRWLQTAAIETAFIDPGEPWQNGADESFNGKFRDQSLSLQWFRNRLEAKVSIETLRRHYNDVRRIRVSAIWPLKSWQRASDKKGASPPRATLGQTELAGALQGATASIPKSTSLIV